MIIKGKGNALLITYELKSKTYNYVPLYNEIKKSLKWWHYMKNVWIVISDENAISWQNRLVPNIVKGDQLLVVEIRKNYGGLLPPDAFKWIHENTIE